LKLKFNLSKYIAKILLCALILMAGTIAGGMLSVALRLEQPQFPEPMNMWSFAAYTFAAGVVLSIALAELSRWLGGNRWARFAAIAWFVYAWMGINNPIEGSIYTSMGGGPFTVVTMLFPCLFVAGAVELLFGGREPEATFSDDLRQFFANRKTAQWILRLAAAVLAFPLVYFVFGMPVGLIVGGIPSQSRVWPSASVLLECYPRGAIHAQRVRFAGRVADSRGLAGFVAAVCVGVWVEPVRGFRALWTDASLLDAVDDARHSLRRTPFGFLGLRLVARRIVIVPSAGTQPCPV
jgi:hypothetical protein